MINNEKTIYPNLILGPIIGRVTENTGRIIMEFDRDCEITLELFEEPSSIKIKLEKQQEMSDNKENINTTNFNTQSTKINGLFENSKNNNLIDINQNYEFKKKISSSLRLTKQCYCEIPVAFQFDNLKDDTKYIAKLVSPVIHAHPMLAELECSFKTLKHSDKLEGDFKIVFISCNSLKLQIKEIPDKFNLWRNLAEKVEQGLVDYVIHIGDQVYLDDAKWNNDEDNCVDRCLVLWRNSYREVFEIKVRQATERDSLLKNTNAWDLEKRSLSKAFIKIISEEYRNNYNNYHEARVLRRVPNLMILDDHDIFDNFTFHIQDTMYHNSFAHFFSEQARFCYYKYQRLLLEDMDFFQDFSKSMIYEHSWHILNGVAVFIQDFRSCRSWSRAVPNINMLGSKEFFLGKKQQDDIKLCFDKGGLFESAKAAVYASTTPMVFLTKGAAKIGVKNKIEDCLEQWPLNSRSDQTWILDRLNNFRFRTKKNVFIVSGDPHAGVMTKIFKDGKFVLHQVVSSAITQEPPSKVEFDVMKLMLTISKVLSDGYTMKHYKLFRDNNYVVVNFRPEEFDPIDKNKFFRYGIFCKHIRSNRKRIKENDYENVGFIYEKDRKRHCGCGGCQFV